MINKNSRSAQKNSFDYIQDDSNIIFSNEYHEEGKRGELALWRAVITQALMDARSKVNKREMKIEQSRAVSWLSGMSDDFIQVCMFADLDPEIIREKSRTAITEGRDWRKCSKIKNGLHRNRKKYSTLTKIEVQHRDEKSKCIVIRLAS